MQSISLVSKIKIEATVTIGSIFLYKKLELEKIQPQNGHFIQARTRAFAILITQANLSICTPD